MDPNVYIKRISLWTVGFVVALWLLTTTFISIGTGQIGIITRFGKVTGRTLTPGLSLKAPWPFLRRLGCRYSYPKRRTAS